MSISFISGTNANGSAVTSLTVTHNVTGSDHGLLIVSLALRTTTASGTGVSYAGQNLTQLSTFTDGGANDKIENWYLLNPPTGSNTVFAGVSASTKIVLGAASYNGVRQTNTFGASGTLTSTSQAPNISVTTTFPNSWIYNSIAIRTPNTFTAGTNNNKRFDDASSGGAGSSNVQGVGLDLATTTIGLYNVSGTLTSATSFAYSYIAHEFLPATPHNQGTIF